MSCISWHARVFYRDVGDVLRNARDTKRAHCAGSADGRGIEGDGEHEEEAGEHGGAGERVEQGECDDEQGEGGAVGGEGVAGHGSTCARVK